MGKPFKSELAKLGETYRWAGKQDVSALGSFVRESLDTPLYIVGSGGSFSAATYAASLHQRLTGQTSQALTPLRYVTLDRNPGDRVLFLSAGGMNHDVSAAFRKAAFNDAGRIGAICFRPQSTLASLARSLSSDLLAAELPSKGDGFLATNSLLAFFVLLFRGYSSIFGLGELPPAIDDLDQVALSSEAEIAAVVQRPHILALYGPEMEPLAVDLESKFSEAGLSGVQLADFRNFGHGRHHWIAKKAAETGIIAFISSDVAGVARSTLELIGKRAKIATVVSTAKPGPRLCVSALPAVFEVTRIAGAVRGIDPGRPGVPEFGRKIYNLRAFSTLPRIGTPPTEELAVKRKVGNLWNRLNASTRAQWATEAVSFSTRLRAARFEAVVFDFDGTLCSRAERFTALRTDVSAALDKLLRSGLLVGIATGRGQSVGRQVRESISSSHWNRVWIGYYNGGDIATLDDIDHPDLSRDVHPTIERISVAISGDPFLAALASVTVRPTQITLEPSIPLTPQELWSQTHRVLAAGAHAAKVVLSTHSVDVIPCETTKTTLITKMTASLGSKASTLCVGDLGQYPGNDYDLLASPYSLSCDQTSPDPATCWNLAPAGVRGIDATLYYLRHAKIVKNRLTITLPFSDVNA